MLVNKSTDRVCYVLYPLDILGEWIEKAARNFDVSIVVVTGMDWDNDLTPWPAKGEPQGSPDFKGNAPKFLSMLISDIIPEVERNIKLSVNVERTLVGVSLSGLFSLWQWIKSDTFSNIISLSGSFWYDGFIKWLKSQPIPVKVGKAYFLLGNQEAKTKVKAFQMIQNDTQQVVSYLEDKGFNVLFELVPGNHFQYGEERLNRAFTWMFDQTP